jgi:flagellar basal-body rod protein FlgG
MQRALWSAATGMHAQQLQVDTIAHNLANVNTNGFKRSRAEFQDLLYQTVVAPGSRSSSTSRHVGGIQLGLGSKTGAVRKLFGQGDIKATENPLDIVIEGAGFFKVQLPDGNLAYSRDGSFPANGDGQLVTSEGFLLDPPITLPPDTIGVTIGRDGTVSVLQPGQTTANEVGQIELANFVNPTGLLSLGGNVYQPTDASGDPQDGTPGLDGLGSVLQGFLESSNVTIVTELVNMIAAQRAYELNSKAIKAADDMMQLVNNIIR